MATTILCTYFDREFLPRGLALHDSLMSHVADLTLLVLCLDAETERVLRTLDLPRLRIVTLSQLEGFDPELPATRSSRGRLGYYMTCTPSLIRYALSQADAVLYLDADLYFFGSLEPALREFAGGSIYVHEHRRGRTDFDPDGGRFNVGLVGVRNDRQGVACVELWRRQCLEWCDYARVDGKFGDQKYLDEWPVRFDRLVIAQHPGVGAAPWNLGDHRYTRDEQNTVLVDGEPLVCFHFHGLQQVARGVVRTNKHWVELVDPVARRFVYRPYLRALHTQLRLLRQLGVDLASPLGRTVNDRNPLLTAPSRLPWSRATSLITGLRSGALMISWGRLAL
jgi:hypothetical protein